MPWQFYTVPVISLSVFCEIVWIIRKVFDIQVEAFFALWLSHSYDKHENCSVSADFFFLHSVLDTTYFLSKKHPLEEVKTLSSTHACYLLSGRYFAKIHNNAIKFFLFSFLLTSIVRLGYIDSNNVIGIDSKDAKSNENFFSPLFKTLHRDECMFRKSFFVPSFWH